jgi:hypothetical protein
VSAPRTWGLQADSSAPVSDQAVEHQWRISLETDPFDFFLDGYGIVVGDRPAQIPNWRLALATFALDLPQFLVELDDANQGFGMRIDHGFGATGSYYFSEESGGFYVGPTVGYLIAEYTHAEVPNEVAR